MSIWTQHPGATHCYQHGEWDKEYIALQHCFSTAPVSASGQAILPIACYDNARLGVHLHHKPKSTEFCSDTRAVCYASCRLTTARWLAPASGEAMPAILLSICVV